jgi:copper transporter 1
MLFNWYTIDACFLSSEWRIQNNGMFAATCIGAILLVMVVELCRRIGREYDAFLLRQFQRQAHARFPETQSGLVGRITFRTTPLQQLVRAIIHAFTFGGAYIVMLLAMYYNGYVIICICIGAGLGKFFCDWMVVSIGIDIDEKAKGVEETTVCCS